MRPILQRIAAAIGLVAAGLGSAFAKPPYEVWAIDQSNSPGRLYGGTLYVYDGAGLERGRSPADAPVEKVDLGGAAAALCLARTGVHPVRPHMLVFDSRHDRAVISFVASGHVLILDAAARVPVDCIRASAGAGGARQVHSAVPSPDGTYIAVANQNGKLLERIDADFVNDHYRLNTAATIDLAGCLTPNGAACQAPGLRPDNAPICPIIDSTSRYTFVTLRGGGLFVVDAKHTPMRIVAEYDAATIGPNGCLGLQAGSKMYIGSGGGTASHLHGADIHVLPVAGFASTNPPNVPQPRLVFSDTGHGADAHGATLTRHERRLWVADRGRNLLWVIDTTTDQMTDIIGLAGAHSADPTPDLLATSPNGSHVFMSLRGPNPLSADPHVSTGSTPGVGVVKVLAGGRGGIFEGVARASNVDPAGIERADVHALSVRLK